MAPVSPANTNGRASVSLPDLLSPHTKRLNPSIRKLRTFSQHAALSSKNENAIHNDAYAIHWTITLAEGYRLS